MELAIIGDGQLEAFHALFMDATSGEVFEELLLFDAELDGVPFAGGGAGVGVNEWSTRTSIGVETAAWVGSADGRAVAIVLGAIGTGDATVALRFLHGDPVNGDVKRSFTSDEFRTRVKGDPAWLMEPTGTSSGLEMDLYCERFAVVLPGWSKAVAGIMTVDDTVPVAGPATMVSASVPSKPSGYAATAALVGTEAHAGVVNVELAAPGGAEVSGPSPIVPNPIVSSIVGLFRGDGDGSADATLSIASAGAPTLFPQLFFLVHVQAATSVESLTGVAPQPTEMLYDGLPVVRSRAAGIHFQTE